MAAALVIAGFLNSFIRHADMVKIANLAQIVNVIAPILTRGDELLVQSIFYPFELFAKRRTGISLRLAERGPVYEGSKNGQVPYVDASAILAGDRLHVFLTNRSPTDTAPVLLTVVDRPILALENAELLTGPGPKAFNSFEKPDVIKSIPFDAAQIIQGQGQLELPPLSVVATTWRL